MEPEEIAEALRRLSNNYARHPSRKLQRLAPAYRRLANKIERDAR